MNATDSERVDPMLNPPHLGELIRESIRMTNSANPRAPNQRYVLTEAVAPLKGDQPPSSRERVG